MQEVRCNKFSQVYREPGNLPAQGVNVTWTAAMNTWLIYKEDADLLIYMVDKVPKKLLE